MEIKLLGALNYEELKNYLKDKVENLDEVIEYIDSLINKRRCDIVATSGRLSRYPGSVFEILETIETSDYEKNIEFIKRVTGMGHNSITDHDYLVFAIKNVTPVIEQTIIEERFSSFTIKSRREVDFSKVGHYTPNFRNEYGIIKNNEQVQKEYNEYMKFLFNEYKFFCDNGINKEDARFVLPYSYFSNIIMGVDAHTLKDMIIKYTKKKQSNMQELESFGWELYNIAKKHIPYIIDEIDKEKPNLNDEVDEYLKTIHQKEEYNILEKSKLLNSSANIDDTILISALMRRYQYPYDYAKKVYERLCIEDPNFKEKLMKKIIFESDKLELTQTDFQFQIPISFAVLTHLTRHRTHDIVVPDFVPNIDLEKYKIPPTIKDELKDRYINIFEKNKKMYEKFKYEYGIIEEDLVYFTLSGNMVNILTNMNGKTLEHILGLRECNKTQWETRIIAHDMHEEIKNKEDAKVFSTFLGATCMTQGICNEGKESCGKLKILEKNNCKEPIN